MKIRLNTESIRQTSSSVKKQVADLSTKLEQFKGHIAEISNYYQGRDSDMLVSKYKEKVDNLNNSVVKTLNNYTNYFDKASNIYQEIHDEGTKSMKTKDEEASILKRNTKLFDDDILERKMLSE